MPIQQGGDTATDYALLFHTLAAQSRWPDGPLKTIYRRGLSRSLQAELASRDKQLSLEQFIQLSIKIDNLIRSRSALPACPTLGLPAELPTPEPMQIRQTLLSPAERQRRLRLGLCISCGDSGHFFLPVLVVLVLLHHATLW